MRRAIGFANPAVTAKVVNTQVARLIDRKGQIGQHRGQAHVGAEFSSDQGSMFAELAKTSLNGNGNMKHFSAGAWG